MGQGQAQSVCPKAADTEAHRVRTAHRIHVHRTAALRSFGKRETLLLPETGTKRQVTRPTVGQIAEHAATLAQRGQCVLHPTLTVHEVNHRVHRSPVGFRHTESHAAGKAADRLTALGIETDADTFRPGTVPLAVVRQTPFIAYQVYLFAPVITLTLRFLEYGNHAGEHPAVVPVGHVARVGANLIEARQQEGVVQLEAARGLPALNAQLAAFEHLTLRMDQLHIGHTADVRRHRPVRPHHVGLEPNRLAREIPRVVQVQIDLLLREERVESRHVPEIPPNARDGIRRVNR